MEKAIGRPLRRGEVVHHINEDGQDNRPANLVLCKNQAHHFRLHKEQNKRFLMKGDSVKGINKRIFRLRRREEMTQVEFGEILGIAQQYVASLESGYRRPSSSLVFVMATKFEVSESWLKDGKGNLPKEAAFYASAVG